MRINLAAAFEQAENGGLAVRPAPAFAAHPVLFSTRATVDDDGAFHCRAQHRYRQAAAACRVVANGGAYQVHFNSPQRAVTPGQSMVFYAGEVCLGGGVIGGAE